MANPDELVVIRVTAIDDSKKGFSSVYTNLDRTKKKAAETSKAVMGTGNAIGAAGRKAGQAGIQIQQLVGQIQGGTNPMMALSQQAADLGFVLGAPLLGAVGGLAASFAMVLLPSLFDTEDKLEDVIKLMDSLNDTTVTLTEAQKRLREQSIGDEIEAVSEKLKEARKDLKAFATGIAEDDLSEADEKRMVVLQGMIDTYVQQIKDLEKTQRDIRNPINEHADAIDKLIGSMQEEAETLGYTQTQLAIYKLKQMGATQADIERAQALGMVVEAHEDALEKEKETAKFKSEYQKAQKKANADMLKAQEDAAKAMQKNLRPVEDALVDVIMGTKSATEAFRDMARSIIRDLIRMQIQQSITAPLGQLLGGLNLFGGGVSSGNAVGNAANPMAGLSIGTPVAQALGGSVSAGQPYTVGEHGRETFVPTTDGQIIPNGGAQGGDNITVNVNVSTGVSQTVRAEITNLLPQITNAAKSAVADARQRGGSYSKAMGV